MHQYGRKQGRQHKEDDFPTCPIMFIPFCLLKMLIIWISLSTTQFYSIVLMITLPAHLPFLIVTGQFTNWGKQT